MRLQTHACNPKPNNNKTPQRPKTSRAKARPARPRAGIAGLPRFDGPNELYPPHIVKVLNYSQFFNLTGNATAGITGTSQDFSLNGLYDPDITGVGHQPYGFDQICSSTGPYTRYKVIGVRAKLTFQNPSGTAPIRLNSVAAVFNPTTYTQSITGLDLALLAEKHNARVDFIPSSGAQEKVVIIDIPSLHLLYNLTRAQFDTEASLSTGSASANPGWAAYLKIAVADIAQGNNTCGVKVEIAYKTMFYDRYMLASS